MKAEVLSRTDLLFLPEIALVVFMAVFVGALWLVLRPGAKQAYARHGFIPLDNEPNDDSEVAP
ncbi:MAG: cbb3-type cytochrome c oxidase subunit 3 [Nannocystaceae bacterium]|nr:cbb3-type cytochrome c oxidase subunit 3 [Nannocystaceae bacterium]